MNKHDMENSLFGITPNLCVIYQQFIATEEFYSDNGKHREKPLMERYSNLFN